MVSRVDVSSVIFLERASLVLEFLGDGLFFSTPIALTALLRRWSIAVNPPEIRSSHLVLKVFRLIDKISSNSPSIMTFALNFASELWLASASIMVVSQAYLPGLEITARSSFLVHSSDDVCLSFSSFQLIFLSQDGKNFDFVSLIILKEFRCQF